MCPDILLQLCLLGTAKIMKNYPHNQRLHLMSCRKHNTLLTHIVGLALHNPFANLSLFVTKKTTPEYTIRDAIVPTHASLLCQPEATHTLNPSKYLATCWGLLLQTSLKVSISSHVHHFRKYLKYLFAEARGLRSNVRPSEGFCHFSAQGNFLSKHGGQPTVACSQRTA